MTTNKIVSAVEIKAEGLQTIGLDAHKIELHTIRAMALLHPESRLTEWGRENGEFYYSLTVERNGFNASFYSKNFERSEEADSQK